METLAGYLRRLTRNHTTALPEDQVFALGLDLARALMLAHAETPPRHPSLDPEDIAMEDGRPRLSADRERGEHHEDIFLLGALLASMIHKTAPDLAWRLDGAPPAATRTLWRRFVLATLASPERRQAFDNTQEVVRALEHAQGPVTPSSSHAALFRGDTRRSGAAPSSAPVFQSLAPLWSLACGRIIASPIVTSAAVLVPGAGALHAIDRERGRRIAEIALDASSESSPALQSGALYFGTDAGELWAIDSETGATRFKNRIGAMVRSSPLVIDRQVFVGTVEEKNSGSLVALDMATGKTLWKKKVGAVFSSPVASAPHVIIGSDEGQLNALKMDSGEIAWSQRLGGKIRATPALQDDTVYIGDFSGRFSAIKASDGTVRWSIEIGHPIYSSASVQGALCVFGCHEGHIHAVHTETGAQIFQAQCGGPVIASPWIAGDRILAAATDGLLYALTTGGAVLASLKLTDGTLQSSPVCDGACVFIGSEIGVHAVRLVP
ncbi:MAG: PQQ-binding-like beta-propeller repeat protein [Vicinamibacteria bacterium]|jgi:outer membrane protein assembly factor BamB|nr:PQQ-binding-like beta-propeller repeat protein [Vicinamibacteria bacterium]